MNRQRYPTDLPDAQWAVLEPLIPPAKPGGRPRAMDMREIVNAILYVTRTGIPWEYLPHDFPKWQTVYAYHRLWLDDGVWEALTDALRRLVRVKERREPEPSAGIIDSQSVKMTALPGWRGYDAGKKVNGRKRSIVVDTLGLLVRVVVHAADRSDAWGARQVLPLAHAAAARLKKLWGDQHYGGTLAEWAKDTYGWELEIIRRPTDAEGFEVLPRRWVVERSPSQTAQQDHPSTDDAPPVIIGITGLLQLLALTAQLQAAQAARQAGGATPCTALSSAVPPAHAPGRGQLLGAASSDGPPAAAQAPESPGRAPAPAAGPWRESGRGGHR